MKKEWLRTGVLAGVLAVFALLAASVSAGGTARTASAVKANDETGATVKVNVVINRFVRQGRRIVAQGAVVTRYKSDQRAPVFTSKPFTARLLTGRTSFAASQRICNVLRLSLGPLHLEVLGLIVDLDRILLTIRADSEGGLLGSLFCGLAGQGATATPAKLKATASKMTRAARAHGLNQGVSGFQVQVAPKLSQVGEICQILDLTLGPLDLNLLGLLIHLDPIHLRITAERGAGILGDLLCGLAGGSPTGMPPPARAAPTG
jgi:hypothetical protein